MSLFIVVCANGLVDIVNKLTSEAVVLSSFANDIRTSTSDLLQQVLSSFEL